VVVPYDSSGKVDLIPAVAYLRKSTKGERRGAGGRSRQKQEKSLQQQREEILKLARGRFRILAWFEDEGISGWKRGAKRPHYQEMLTRVESLGAKAILCDHIDRFSRANYDDVMEDSGALRKAGVRWVVTVSHGEYDLHAGRRNDIGAIIQFVAAVWAAHEFSRNLGRRIALARRNGAAENRRTGGTAPYGLENDGKGGLVPGDPEEVATVRWVFDQFVTHLRSLRDIAGDLNRRKVPPPRGKAWYAKTVGLLLRQPAYRGTFRFNVNHRGQFFGIDGYGEVVEADDLGGGAGKVFTSADAYADPLIEPALFDRAQERLEALAKDPGRRNRSGEYALTGVLVCGHCGTPMYGVRVRRREGRRSPTVYKCNGNSLRGKGTCRQYQIRESEVLPFLVRLLGREIGSLTALAPQPPGNPGGQWQGQRERVQAERDRLASRIDQAEANLLEVDDARTVKALSAKVSGMRDELDKLDAELSAAPADDSAADAAAREALAKWWEEVKETVLLVPLTDRLDPAPVRAVDPKRVNEALLDVGCEVRLRWRTEGYTSMTYKARGKDGVVRRRGGSPRERHVLDGGRFRLGQRRGLVPVKGKVAGTPASRTTPAASATPGGP
jgi:DNA invertase Pin-like site-specific DNA recombinase